MDHLSTPAPHTLARASDPSTSHLAAHMATNLAADHRRRVQDAMATAPYPLGAEQIAELCGLDAYQVRKRLPELEEQGLAELAPGDRKTSSGRRERLWKLATAKV